MPLAGPRLTSNLGEILEGLYGLIVNRISLPILSISSTLVPPPKALLA